MAQIDVAGQRIDLLAVHQNLNSRDARQVDRQRIDDRKDGQRFVERSASVSRGDFTAEIDERLALGREVNRANSGPRRDRGGQARRRRRPESDGAAAR